MQLTGVAAGLLQIFAGWVLTLIVAALVAAALTAFTVYAPSKAGSDDIVFTSKGLESTDLAMIHQMNATNNAANVFNSGLAANLLVRPYLLSIAPSLAVLADAACQLLA